MSWVDYDCKMRNSRSMIRKLVTDRDIEVSKYLCISRKKLCKITFKWISISKAAE